MPILFKTCVKEGAVHGKGVFAEEDIPAGATWWVADNEVKPATNNYLPNIIYTQENIKELTEKHQPEQVSAILHQTMHYVEGNMLIYLRDGTQSLNHSFNPTSLFVTDKDGDWKKLKSVAARDIKTGQELTENYSTYIKRSNNWVEELYKKYLPERLEFEKSQKITKNKEE